ncbi:DUF934 domain-containing protein [Pelagibius litoralis]|uniref:DUF934 domain-containing protein n=1 Tax=Pelagibius litoralis TaxID=374515 RepID=A0A967KG70_9PROT|nr:DUF934 domain-containing protein [Pelagibius litoralis]NIA70111.1 DUF934 domain-containing protein [Pelagibius litoralis]
MPLLKDGQVVDDPWANLPEPSEAEGQSAGETAIDVDLIVTLEQWRNGREALLKRNGRLGLRLRSDQPPAEIVDDLEHFDLIALEFPKFSDGRAYSYARLLRERHGFKGELRAVGNILRDQLFFMLRCGFDSFEIAGQDATTAWREAIAEMGVWYQPTGDGRLPSGVLGGAFGRSRAVAAE